MFFDKKKKYQRIDYILILVTFALLAFGLLMVHAATLSYGAVKHGSYMRTQGFATLLGLFAMVLLMFTPTKLMKRLYIPIYVFCTGLLLFTLVGDALGGPIKVVTINHSRSWLSIGGFQFQPAEFVKIGLVVCLATYMEKNRSTLNEPFTLLKLLAFAFLPVLLILLQPDKGTALVFVGIIAVMFFIGGISFKYILLALGMLAVVVPVFWFRLSDYAKNRIFDFLEPERDILGSGMQGYLGKLMVGSGKISGRGLFQGVLNQNNYLPLKHSDFIFPVIGEELGIRGGLFLFVLYLLLLYRMLYIAKHGSYFTRVAVVGFISMFLIHIWENVAMTMGLMPITGIPLPFISHGGSFQLSNLIVIGIILGIKYSTEYTVKSPGQKIDNLLR
ncbi:MAG: FtsW/RodA/SpoVE family cell cycle protein [Tissierellia bacterium]|nr:FtsW/RodA/SpoVE family cell cycle protein [Tissierellia bacterium]